MSSRAYPDDSDYRRGETRRRGEHTRDRDHRERVEPTRDSRRVIDARVDRRDIAMTDAMDTRMDNRMEDRLDPRIDHRGGLDIRSDPRTNTTSRIDRGPDRGLESRSAEPMDSDVLFRDPNTGQMYRQVPTSRSAYTRGDRDDRTDRDYPDPSRSRPTMDNPIRDREPMRPELGEYWCPGDGIEREVIQHEICKYLGQDATCRPGSDAQGRPGYWVRAYRPFTTAMERSLREETHKWQRERDRRRRHGESRGSYADLADQQESRRRYPPVPDPMDIEDDDYNQRAPIRSRDRDRDPHRELEPPRPVASGRVVLPTTSGYSEPGYPASQYTISASQPGYPSGQPAYYPTERVPRDMIGGNTTPPTIARPGQPGGYVPSGYTSRTSAPISQSIPAPYGSDPRSREMVGAGYPPGYPETRRR